MHLVGAALPAGGRRTVAMWRKRLARGRVPVLVPATLLLLLGAALCAVTLLVMQLRAVERRQKTGAADEGVGDADVGCARAEVGELRAFDAHMLEEKARGRRAQDFENRHQETVWDMLVMRPGGGDIPALFPAWSDKMWYVGEYGRGLRDELTLLTKVAARAVRSDRPAVRYVHTRLDRLRGMQFAAAVDAGDGREVLVSLQRPIGEARCTVQRREVAQRERVHVLLPYARRAARLRLFLENVKFLRERALLDVVVVVCVLHGEDVDLADVDRLRRELFGGDAEAVVRVSRNSGDADGGFSRGVALREAARTMPDDAVLFLCDVDMVVLPGFVQRCARNAIRGAQVFYPVFYSLFPYANARPAIAQRNGFWRTSSFGMACVRNADLSAVDPFGDAEIRFQGWGSEDVYMFEKIRNSSNLVAFRSVEPGLMHRWHSKKCDKQSKAYLDCMKTNFATMGHPLRIGPALLGAFDNVEELYERVQNA